MDKNKILNQIDDILKKKGITVSQIDKFKSNLLKETADKEKVLMDEVYKAVQKKSEEFLFEKLDEIEQFSKKQQDNIIKALENIKIEPKVSVNVDRVNIPEVKIPEIKLPIFRMPEVKIPIIKVPDIKMPDSMRIEGLKDFIQNLFSYLKQEALSNIDRDNPLPVILTDEKGKFYRAGIAIAGGSVGTGGGGGNSGEMLSETAGTLKQRISYITGTSNIEYVGEAQSNVQTSELKWRIKKLVYDTSNNLLEINWCNGETGFKYSWDERLTYNYI